MIGTIPCSIQIGHQTHHQYHNPFLLTTLILTITSVTTSSTFVSQGFSAFAQTQSINDYHGSSVTDRQQQQEQQSPSIGGGRVGPENNTIAANFTQIFNLKFNQTAIIASQNLTIKFSKVDDSRCPPNAMCIWEGDALVYLNVTKDGKDLGSVTLGVNGRLANNSAIIDTGKEEGEQQQHQRYEIHLLSLSRPITKSDYYIATLLVTKPDTKVSIVLLGSGQRDSPLQITKIFPDHIDGVAFIECPAARTENITMKIGDTVGNAFPGQGTTMTLLSIIPNAEGAVFLKIVYPFIGCL